MMPLFSYHYNQLRRRHGSIWPACRQTFTGLTEISSAFISCRVVEAMTSAIIIFDTTCIIMRKIMAQLSSLSSSLIVMVISFISMSSAMSLSASLVILISGFTFA